MNFGWEKEEDKIARYMNVSPKKKLEWLQAMHDMLLAVSSPERRKIFWKLRGIK